MISVFFVLARMVGFDAGPARPPSQPRIAQKMEAFPKSRPAEMFFPDAVQAELKSAVEAILPKELSIQQTRLGCSPSDWHSFDDQAGFCVEAAGDNRWLRVWFLPVDWIGIRKVENLRCSTCYWDGILKNERFTIITHASREEYHHLFARLLNASTPSLCNGGRSTAERIFGYHSEKTDRIAADLVNRYCRTGKELGEAANSLIVLGVPSRTVMLRALREVRPGDITHGLDMDGIYHVLGDMEDTESTEALCDQLRRIPSKFLAYALAGKSHPKLGPALHKALRRATGNEDIAAIALEIGYQKYHPAGPDLVAAFQRITNLYYAGDVANALAALRYREAIPLIDKAVAQLLPNENGSFRDGGLRVALLRLTGDWGIPSENARMHIVGPRQARVGEAIRLSIYVENIGKEPIRTWHHIEFGLRVNGKPLIEREDRFILGGGLSAEYRPASVMVLSYDLGPRINKPGSYQVRYGNGENALSSNAIMIEVIP
jgi:hypothetical protein